MEKKNFQEELAAKVLERVFKNAESKWKNPVINTPFVQGFNPVTGTIYSGRNAALLSLAMFDRMGEEATTIDPRFVTYKEIKEHGWKFKDGVGKGAGYFVVYSKKFIPAKYLNDDKLSEDDKKKKERFMLKPYYVFNMADLDVPPIRKSVMNILTWTPEERQKLYENTLKNSEAKIRFDAVSVIKGINCYTPAFDTIHLVNRKLFKTHNIFYDTAIHEIAHSTGHESRLKRNLTGKFGSNDYAREEMVAELTATILRIQFGGEESEDTIQHNSYLWDWFRGRKLDVLGIVSDAAKAADYIKKNMMFKDSKVPPFDEKLKLLLSDGDLLGEGDEKKPVKKARKAKKDKEAGEVSLFA